MANQYQTFFNDNKPQANETLPTPFSFRSHSDPTNRKQAFQLAYQTNNRAGMLSRLEGAHRF